MRVVGFWPNKLWLFEGCSQEIRKRKAIAGKALNHSLDIVLERRCVLAEQVRLGQGCQQILAC